ncbi:MAG: hypothetical protein QF903_01605 [Planctomycetota bacterium]|nr:hypothetical protein [Planctomycetota bacterium]
MKQVLLTSLAAAVVAAGIAWVARGIYDEIAMDEGVFHVVNAAATQRTIELALPSGERRSAVIESGQAVDFHVENAGEGAVSVMADAEVVDSVGYVTTHNGLVVIVVQSDRALFSQYLRR